MKNKNVIYVLLIPLLIVVAVQICLKNPMTREMFTSIEKYEDIEYGHIDSVPSPRLEIILKASEPSEDIKVIYNSEEITVLNTSRITIPIDCDGVVQIQNNTNREITVHVNYNPELLKVSISNTNFTAGIGTLCRVNLN